MVWISPLIDFEIPRPHAGETPKPKVEVKRPLISFIIRKVLLELALHLGWLFWDRVRSHLYQFQSLRQQCFATS